MIRLPLSLDNHHYLVEIDKSPTRNVFKFSGPIGGMVAVCAFIIWAFTPLSDQINHTSVQGLVSHSIGLDSIVPKANARSVVQAEASNEPEEDFHGLESVSSMLVSDIASKRVLEDRVEDLNNDVLETDSKSEMAKVQIKIPETVKFYIISPGDTLTKIFADANIPISQAIKLAKMKAGQKFNSLSLGKTLRIYFDENEQWETLEYDFDKLTTLIVTHTAGEIEVSRYTKQVDYREFTASGVIESSLGSAAEMAGLSLENVNALVDIFKWEFDFARDMQAGDTFSVVYQKAFIDDDYVDDGPILAASFTANQQTIDAIRYTDSVGLTAYFQPDGESLRRGFLRTPIKFARITSGFGKRRHPIQKIWKKHMGVDYAAKRGTPILATADGVVQYAGTKGGYGKTIILRHGGTYTTLYAHLSKIDKTVRSGRAVQQGQVVGYVGRTGWATGDHLHYEFRQNGRHKNPLKVKLPKTLPLAKKETQAFSKQAKPLLAKLIMLKGIDVAQR